MIAVSWNLDGLREASARLVLRPPFEGENPEDLVEALLSIALTHHDPGNRLGTILSLSGALWEAGCSEADALVITSTIALVTRQFSAVAGCEGVRAFYQGAREAS